MLTVTIRNKKYVIPLESIQYIESSSRKVIVHTTEQDYSYYQRLDNVSEQLPSEQFVRIHKSYLVAVGYIDSYTNYRVRLANGRELPISATYRQSAKDALKYAIQSNSVPTSTSITGSIICIRGAYKGSVIRMYSDQKILIGRDEQCDICYNLPFVSRRQCVLIFRAKTNTYEIMDCSTNGTYLLSSPNALDEQGVQSSHPISPGNPVSVAPGTILHFGDTDHLFQLA